MWTKGSVKSIASTLVRHLSSVYISKKKYLKQLSHITGTFIQPTNQLYCHYWKIEQRLFKASIVYCRQPLKIQWSQTNAEMFLDIFSQKNIEINQSYEYRERNLVIFTKAVVRYFFYLKSILKMLSYVKTYDYLYLDKQLHSNFVSLSFHMAWCAITTFDYHFNPKWKHKDKFCLF